jgi:hypothetical protein
MPPVAWTLDAWIYFCDRPELVREAWRNCKVGDLDFSWESLTSPAATDNIKDLLANDAIFCRLIGSKDPPLPYSSDPAFLDAEAQPNFDDNEDNSSAPVDELLIALTEPVEGPLEVAAEDFIYIGNVEEKDDEDQLEKEHKGEEESEESDAAESPGLKMLSDTADGDNRDFYYNGDIDLGYVSDGDINYDHLDGTPPISDTNRV